jgi:hypothetical protein
VLLLLVIPLGLLWLFVSVHRERLGFGNLSVRGALVLAFLAFEILLLAITDLTSIDHHFTAGTVAVAWSIIIILLLLATWTQITSLVQRARSREGIRFGLVDRVKRLTSEDRFWLVIVTALFGLLVATGFLYRPSYADSMIYHLARVEHWIQNRTVAPFATHYLPQVEFSPLSEFNLAHLHLLAGTDRFDACMELVSALVCIVGVSELARLLGASRATQIAASVICATIPTGILLASSTDNDYLAAAAGVGLLLIVTNFSFVGRWGYRAIALGATIGLSYMAKSTISLLIGPAVLVLLAVVVFRQVRTEDPLVTLRRGINQIVVIGASAVAVVGVFLVQTAQLFGSLEGPTTKGLIDSHITISGMAANTIRATAANFQIGDGSAGIQTYVSKIALGILGHTYSIFGIAQNNPDYYYGTQHGDMFATTYYSPYQRVPEFGANPWNILLFVSAILVLAVALARGHKHFRIVLVLALSLGAGFLLFTGLDKWAPFNVRYQLPLLVVASVVIAIALSIFPRWVTRLVMVGLVIACLPQLLDNSEAPLVPPHQYHGSYLAPYFGMMPSLAAEAPGYQTITTMLAQSTCTQSAIGNRVYFEYPLWAGLQHERYKGVLNDFDVHNATKKLESTYRPCATITQRGTNYITPNNGTVNIQQGVLALSIRPSDATTIRTEPAEFESTVRGVRVLPGGGWSTDAYGTLPFLRGNGSLYLFSNSTQTIELQLHLVSTVPQSSLTISGANGHSIPTTIRHTTIDARLVLHQGINHIKMSAEPNAKTTNRRLILSEVGLAAIAK